MAAPSPPRFFAAWRVEAPFSAVSRSDGFYTVFYLIRGVALHESPSCSREDPLGECGCPCDPLSCLLFSALWLRCNQSTLVQETRSAKDLDLTCATAILFCDATCHQVGPMSLDWPVNPLGRFDSSRSSLPPDVPSGVQQRGAFPVSIHSRWRQGAIHTQSQILQRTTGCDGCGSFLSEGLRCITWNTRAWWDQFSPDKGTENSNSNISRNSWTTTTLFVSRKCMERMSIFRLSRCWLRDFDSLVPFYLTMIIREDRLSAFTRTFCPKKLFFTCSYLSGP